MTSPTLYTYPTSPPAQTVLMTAEYIGLKLNLKQVNSIARETRSPEFVKINPQHTIPTLDDSGFILWDSHAISAYLVEKYGKDDSLYPEDPQKRAVIHQRWFFDNGIFNTIHSVFAKYFRGPPPEQADIAPLEEAYELLDKFVEDGNYAAGDVVTIADFSIFTTITCAALLLPLDENKYPKAAQWYKKMQALPCSSVVEEGTKMLSDIINDKKV